MPVPTFFMDLPSFWSMRSGRPPLLSVLMVWLVGHWFANQEQHLGARILRWRMLGAAMMLAAIVLVIR